MSRSLAQPLPMFTTPLGTTPSSPTVRRRIPLPAGDSLATSGGATAVPAGGGTSWGMASPPSPPTQVSHAALLRLLRGIVRGGESMTNAQYMNAATEAIAAMTGTRAKRLLRQVVAAVIGNSGGGERCLVGSAEVPPFSGSGKVGAWSESPPTIFIDHGSAMGMGYAAMHIVAGPSPSSPCPYLRTTVSTASLHSKEDASSPCFTSERRTSNCDGFKALNQYVLTETLGKGTSGKVKLAFDTERNTTVAIKIIKRGRTELKQQQLHREICVMKRLRHKNLVSLFEVIDDPESDRLYLVMQYVDDGPLLTVDPNTLTCTPLDPNVAAEAARQLTAGLAYLHSHRIVHRDIKPENILKSRDGTVYLCDFGLSEEFDGERDRVSGWHGSPLFMAPEVHAMQSSSDLQAVDGYAADVYSLGVTMYLMLTGRLPFATPGNARREAVTFPRSTPPAWQRTLRGMLQPDPTYRLALHVVRQHLKSQIASIPSIERACGVVTAEEPAREKEGGGGVMGLVDAVNLRGMTEAASPVPLSSNGLHRFPPAPPTRGAPTVGGRRRWESAGSDISTRAQCRSFRL